jgi:hypothetical protein
MNFPNLIGFNNVPILGPAQIQVSVKTKVKSIILSLSLFPAWAKAWSEINQLFSFSVFSFQFSIFILDYEVQAQANIPLYFSFWLIFLVITRTQKIAHMWRGFYTFYNLYPKNLLSITKKWQIPEKKQFLPVLQEHAGTGTDNDRLKFKYR